MAFSPKPAGSARINVSSSSQSVQVANRDRRIVRVHNDGTATVWLAFGNSAVTAAVATGLPVGPGVSILLDVGSGDGTALYMAAIAAASTGYVYATPGAE